MRWALVLTIVAAIGTAPLGAQSAAKLSRTEVVVIADLSNRIDGRLHAGQVARDTAIVHLIAAQFGKLVKRNLFLFSRDRLRMVYVGGQAGPEEPRVDVAHMNEAGQVVVKKLPYALEAFTRSAAQPYFARRTEFQGADLWSWFHKTAPNTLPVSDPDREVRTRIIVLTDGYLEFGPRISREAGTSMRMAALRGKANWERLYPQYKLKSSGTKLLNTEVLVLELSPIRPMVNTTEQDIIERYWSDWFGDMGAKSSFLTANDALPSVQDAIEKFLAP